MKTAAKLSLWSVVRIRDEEELLTTELPGYTAYAQQVRHRLVPGLC